MSDLNVSPERGIRCMYDEDEEQVLHEMKCKLKEVTHNYQLLLSEWKKLQELLKSDQIPKDFILVHKDDLALLATETSQLRTNLPSIINKNNIASTVARADSLEDEVAVLKRSNQKLETECAQWKTKFETSAAECQKEKEENLQLRCQLQELSEQLTQQSDFSSSLGAASCTLLWRVSRSEDSVQAILSGTKVEDFLVLVTSTLESYVTAYKDDWPEDPTDETSFILALVGIVTNVAASAYGRDFLITRDSGRRLVDTFTNFLVEAPLRKSAKLKNLLLMALYNMSINQKALKYICSKQGIMGLLAWHLQEETDGDNRLNTIRLIQSLVADASNPSVTHELTEALPKCYLQTLTTDKNKDVQELALDLLMDLRQVNSEQ